MSLIPLGRLPDVREAARWLAGDGAAAASAWHDDASLDAGGDDGGAWLGDEAVLCALSADACRLALARGRRLWLASLRPPHGKPALQKATAAGQSQPQQVGVTLPAAATTLCFLAAATSSTSHDAALAVALCDGRLLVVCPSSGDIILQQQLGPPPLSRDSGPPPGTAPPLASPLPPASPSYSACGARFMTCRASPAPLPSSFASSLSSSHSDDDAEGLLVCFQDGAVGVDALHIAALLRRRAVHEARLGTAGTQWAPPPPLPSHRWPLPPGRGGVVAAAVVGPAPCDLSDALEHASRRSGSHPHHAVSPQQHRPPTRLLVNGGFDDSLVSICDAREAGSGPSALAAAAAAVASKAASAVLGGVMGLFTRARRGDASGGGGNGGGDGDDGGGGGSGGGADAAAAAAAASYASSAPSLCPPPLLVSSLRDPPRAPLRAAAVAPCGRLAALPDTLGRVILIDLSSPWGDAAPIAMWKGLRDAQVGWAWAPRGTTAATARRTGHSNDAPGATQSGASGQNNDGGLVLVVFAPRLGGGSLHAFRPRRPAEPSLLLLRPPPSDGRAAPPQPHQRASRVGPHARLVAPAPVLLGRHHEVVAPTSGAAAPRPPAPRPRCCVLKPDGTLAELVF